MNPRPPRDPPFGRLRARVHTLQHPLITLLLASMLAAEVFIFTGPAAGLRRGTAAYARLASDTRDLHLLRDRNSGELRLIDPERESWGDIATAMHARSEDMLLVEYHFTDEQTGLWAPTRRLRATWLHITPFTDDAFTPAELRQARSLVVEYLRATGAGPEWSLAEVASAGSPAGTHSENDASATGGGGGGGEVLISGYARNALTLLLIAATVWSLGWVLEISGAYVRWRGGRRLARLRCPSCNYDLTGTPAPPCPECGAMWEPETNRK